LFDTIPKIAAPKVLGTLSKYILIDASTVDESSKEGLCLVDQRAAHCRVIFERLIEQEEKRGIEVEQLLVPYTLELTPIESAALLNNIEMLNELGIHIKEFGPNTFTIDGIPKIFGSIDIKSFVYDLIKGLCDADGGDSYKQEKEKRIALAASRISISSKAKLSIQEAEELVKNLLRCKNPKICPSGKATMIHISSAELAKQFQ
jgi:DNA mismatch repair protein MutL